MGTLTNYGTILSVKDSILDVSGISSVTSGELIKTELGSLGLALNLERVNVKIVMFSESGVSSGNRVKRLKRVLNTLCDIFHMGSVMDSVGTLKNDVNVSNFGPISWLSFEHGVFSQPVERRAPSIMSRQSVWEPMLTGYPGIDCMLPLGRGQRELIIGDRQSGKTTIAVDVILNQTILTFSYVKTIFFGVLADFNFYQT